MPRKVYKVFRATPSPEPGAKVTVDILAEITDAPMAYVHSFAITQKYVILTIWQSDYNMCVLDPVIIELGVDNFLNSGASSPQYKDILSSLKPWDPKRDTLFYIISRERGGVIAKFKVSPQDVLQNLFF